MALKGLKNALTEEKEAVLGFGGGQNERNRTVEAGFGQSNDLGKNRQNGPKFTHFLTHF